MEAKESNQEGEAGAVVADETPAVEDVATPAAEETPVGEEPTAAEAPTRSVMEEVVAGLMRVGVDVDPHERLYSATSFDELNLPDDIKAGLIEVLGYKRPFQIQAQALPQILRGKDVIAQAKTGTGKTVAFTVGMLASIDPAVDRVQALCLTTSREVAHQIMEQAAAPLGSRMPGLRTLLLLPGEHARRVTEHLVVATPGKAKELLGKRLLDLSQLKVLVLDEADKMISSLTDTQQVLTRIPETTQRLLFSATYSDETLRLAKTVVRRRSNNGEKPVVIRLAHPQAQILEEIAQFWIDVGKFGDRMALLNEMYASLELMQSIVFVNTRAGAEEVARAMQAEGYDVSYLHGSLEHAERDRLMQRFRSGESRILITTDVLSRGVDVEAVTMVVNYHIPIKRDEQKHSVPDPETYVHRIGRTGRAGRHGVAITFVANEEDKRSLRAIEAVYSPDREMIHECDPADLVTLAELIKNRRKANALAAAKAAPSEAKSNP